MITDATIATIAERYGARAALVRPVVVRAWLRAPIAWPSRPARPVRLDGVAQGAALAAVLGTMPEPPGRETVPRDIPSPIARVTWGSHTISACSDPIPVTPYRWGNVHMRKRADAEHYVVPSGRVLIAGGEFKCLDRVEAVMVAAAVEWHARADVERLLPLLSLVTGVGRAPGGGLGEVLSWDVYDDPEDAALVRGGRAMRALPLDGVPGVTTTAASSAQTSDARALAAQVSHGMSDSLDAHNLALLVERMTAVTTCPIAGDISRETVNAPYWHPRMPRVECVVPEPVTGG